MFVLKGKTSRLESFELNPWIMDVENSLEYLYFHAGSVRGVAFSPVVIYCYLYTVLAVTF